MQPAPLEAMPMPNGVEFKQLVGLPGQVNVTLLHRGVIVIEHDIGERWLTRPAAPLADITARVKRYFIMLKSVRQLCNDAFRPLDDEPFGLLNPINVNSRTGPYLKISDFWFGDFNRGCEVTAFDRDFDRSPFGGQREFAC